MIEDEHHCFLISNDLNCSGINMLPRIYHMGKASHFKTFPQTTYQKTNFSLDLFFQLYFKIQIFGGFVF